MGKIMPKTLMSTGFFIFVSFVFLTYGQAYDYTSDSAIDNNLQYYNAQAMQRTQIQETDSTQTEVIQTTGTDVVDLQSSGLTPSSVVNPGIQPTGALTGVVPASAGAYLPPVNPDLNAVVDTRTMVQPIRATQGPVATAGRTTGSGWLQDIKVGLVAVLQDADILPPPRVTSDNRY